MNGYHGGTATQEGTVSIDNQDFTGHKWFHRGIHVWDDAGGAAVPLVVQSGSLATASAGAHIQEWWVGGGTPLAFLDTQPTLRLGFPGGADGFIELCSAVAGSQTVKLTCGIGATQAQTIRFPLTFPTAGNILQVDTAGGSNVNLKWSTAPAGHTILEEGGALIQRDKLNFVGAGITAADDFGSLSSKVTLNAATSTTEGIVSNTTQSFGGRKTFIAGATMQGTGASEPVLTVQGQGAAAAAHIQEWKDNGGVFSVGYMTMDGTHRLGSPSAYTGSLELCSVGSSNYTVLRCADTPAAVLVYKWPANTPTASQVLNVSSVAGSTINLAWATGGTGSGANIQLSNLDASGTAVTPSVTINTHVGFTTDGGWNIGAPAHRVGVIYIKSAFWLYAAGSVSGPIAAGFLDPSGGYSRFLVNGDQRRVAGWQ